MKQLKFQHFMVEEIIAGKKTKTWRLFDDKDLQMGDVLALIDSDSGIKFADAEIINLTEKKLGELREVDFSGHEKFKSKQDILEAFTKYYGVKVDWQTIVKIIQFKLARS